MHNGITIKRVIAAILIVLLIVIIKNWKDVKQGFVEGVKDGQAQSAKSE
ncbi:hypothetical protein [Mucilaginibacter terrae]|uniref:Uncharacterized protein n=1 Tax=Mucilaginibacter terrae TaxID=1955052 RepID=A0ABU3GWD0_9SPHI|nr:hypothetical protein [Mucilaginibacter terrae]MDT3404073.1 hypothetical protein [Mucilaginibacter terrae]